MPFLGGSSISFCGRWQQLGNRGTEQLLQTYSETGRALHNKRRKSDDYDGAVLMFPTYQSIVLILQFIQVSKIKLLQQVTIEMPCVNFLTLSIERLARYHRSWASKGSGSVHQPKRKQPKRDGVVDLPGSTVYSCYSGVSNSTNNRIHDHIRMIGVWATFCRSLHCSLFNLIVLFLSPLESSEFL